MAKPTLVTMPPQARVAPFITDDELIGRFKIGGSPNDSPEMDEMVLPGCGETLKTLELKTPVLSPGMEEKDIYGWEKNAITAGHNRL